MGAAPKFSIIIPAHNEEKHLPLCLDAIAAASKSFPGAVQTIVVLNRCTDDTEAVARARADLVLRQDRKSIAATRNCGAQAARGDIVITIDADSRMTPNMLARVDHRLRNPRCVGGGVIIHPERVSLGIALTALVFWVLALPLGLSAGMFWCRREDFAALGGFDERLHSGEDIDFARRLKALGRSRGQRYGTIMSAQIVTSCRKFDMFGDWFTLKLLVKNPRLFWDGLHGKSRELGERYWYNCRSSTTPPPGINPAEKRSSGGDCGG
jgi:glycosyltransferase involved in cell wall biosynthesis